MMQIYVNKWKNKCREQFMISLIDELLRAYLSVLETYLKYIRVISVLNQLYLCYDQVTLVRFLIELSIILILLIKFLFVELFILKDISIIVIVYAF